jgi:SAV_6107-like HEPN
MPVPARVPVPVPVLVPGPPVRRSGAALFAQAQGVLHEARAELSSGERFRLAHLGALRLAAALFAERAQPTGRRPRGPANAWVLLTSVAPELAEWAAYFAAGASTRAALEAGAIDVVSDRQADDLVRAVEQFADLVAESLGLLAVPLAS